MGKLIADVLVDPQDSMGVPVSPFIGVYTCRLLAIAPPDCLLWLPQL